MVLILELAQVVFGGAGGVGDVGHGVGHGVDVAASVGGDGVWCLKVLVVLVTGFVTS